MAEYSELVTRILKNDCLVDATKRMLEREPFYKSALNLLVQDWSERLENDTSFQDCQFRPIPTRKSPAASNLYEYETSRDVLFNIVLAGYCRFSKSYDNKSARPSIIISQSEPLNKIAQVMTKDLGPVQISEEFKFNFKECSVLSCAECSSSHAFFAGKGYKLNKTNQPCITDTKIFDGKNVFNRFESQMEDMFPNTFIAILHLKINTRYSYTDASNNNQKTYRIGGHVSDLVAFHDAKLFLTKSINLGDLTPIEMIEEPKNADVVSKEVKQPEMDDVFTDAAPEEEDKKVQDNGFLAFEEEEFQEPPSKKPKVEEALSFLI